MPNFYIHDIITSFWFSISNIYIYIYIYICTYFIISFFCLFSIYKIMSNKKRSKNENDESTSLPLENSELLIEYIHNLKSCLNVYRREIQEKNKYISIIKNDLSFHECILTNVNVVWSVFNNDLLNLLCNNEQKRRGEY
ncbi:hypothetical protein PFLG_01723 [Plasmodium falciparum RAJ116]|uniref:Uncharacterized protein n=1 Tax=Plasmodium falciparum RAJ116 TaxID=580058 RepID=A0A0L0CWI5_PLAFA|nr:hypothetical protein PFLG_01723 [Plasmodium falciparum RAJ116]